MAKRSEYTIHGPPASGSSPSQLHKSLTIRRENKGVSPDLRALYRDSADHTDHDPTETSKALPNGVPTTPNMPPTPPVANGEPTEQNTEEIPSEAAVFRSTLVTPINQHSPPTPDNTPPRARTLPVLRPFLGTQASFASTRAESFKTAKEDITSDDESIIYRPASRPTPRSLAHPFEHGGRAQSRPLEPSILPSSTAPQSIPSSGIVPPAEPLDQMPKRQETYDDVGKKTESRRVALSDSTTFTPPAVPASAAQTDSNTAKANRENVKNAENTFEPRDLQNVTVRRGPSLRDRLHAARNDSHSASTEKFAHIIGWTNGVTQDQTAGDHTNREAVQMKQENKRLSGISTSSTIDAIVMDSSPLPRRRTTLRKVAKNDSLRSASSPLPVSQRASQQSNSDSPHRLVHKKARLSNENRWSFGSEVSRSRSLSSNVVIPKIEVIKVAVIPERSSSLHSSANSSKRHSLSTSSAPTHSKKPSEGLPPSSWQRKRTMSESDRGREKQQPLLVPPRSSSLSGGTSRSTSRANSVTSENVRARRQEAETDLRKTLDKMESERLLSSLRGSQFEQSPIDTPSKPPQRGHLSSTGHVEGARQHSLTPGTSEWAALRPPSVLETPFSQPSYQSASPEINEATAINFFPHNNRSLQLIEPNVMQESRAVREVRKQAYVKDEVSSPLRNPRRPPEPPQFNVIPPSPADELNKQLSGGQPERRWGSTGRRPSQRRSESFVKTLSRGLSLKNARNRKADQDLDGSLHPFWRPRAFWNDVENEPGTAEAGRGLRSDGVINNSLGLPQERIIITGPVSLVRRISERRRQNRALMKESSQGSLSRLRASRQLYKAPIFGLNLRFLGLGDIQDRLLYARQRREDEKREKARAALRESIGANVISQGDSRFPASSSGLIRA